jgi:hypothetical protein
MLGPGNFVRQAINSRKARRILEELPRKAAHRLLETQPRKARPHSWADTDSCNRKQRALLVKHTYRVLQPGTSNH